MVWAVRVLLRCPRGFEKARVVGKCWLSTGAREMQQQINSSSDCVGRLAGYCQAQKVILLLTSVLSHCFFLSYTRSLQPFFLAKVVFTKEWNLASLRGLKVVFSKEWNQAPRLGCKATIELSNLISAVAIRGSTRCNHNLPVWRALFWSTVIVESLLRLLAHCLCVFGDDMWARYDANA